MSDMLEAALQYGAACKRLVNCKLENANEQITAALFDEIKRLRAELAACRNATAEDALRYAFIRAKHAADDDCWYVCGVGEADGDILDAKIDEARKGEGE